MAHIHVTGIVTRYVNYKDNDRIITIFTRERGRIDARARGCRRAKSPLMACAQPFVYGAFQLFEGKERYTVDQCDLHETFYPLRDDIDRLRAGYAMLMLIQAAVQPGEANEPLFSTLYYALSFLCYSDIHPLDITFCFIVRFLEHCGFRPALTACAACGTDLRKYQKLTFSSSQGGVLCPLCEPGNERIAANSLTLEAIRRMLQLEDAGMQRVQLPKQVRRELSRILPDYLEYTLDKPIAALKALKALLEDTPQDAI